jgi:magnesium chelatase subunit D
MGARRRMAATKGMVLSLLVEAYQKRDLVGLVSFGGTSARVALPPTRSVRAAARLLSDLPVGGLTPLAHGLATAGQVVATARRRDPTVRPVVVLLTDGRANVPIHPHGDPFRDALRVVSQLAASGVTGLVVDTESGPVKLGRARELAQAWKSDVRMLDDLTGRRLPEAIRRALLAG